MAETSNEELTKLQQEIDILRQERDASNNLVVALKRKLDASTVEHDAINLIVDATKQELDALKLKHDATKHDLVVTKEESDALKHERDALTVEIGTLKGIPAIPEKKSLTKFISAHKQEYFGKKKLSETVLTYLATLISYIAGKQQARLSELQQAVSLECRTTQRYVRILRESGCIEFRGGRRNGVFALTERGKKLLTEANL